MPTCSYGFQAAKKEQHTQYTEKHTLTHILAHTDTCTHEFINNLYMNFWTIQSYQLAAKAYAKLTPALRQRKPLRQAYVRLTSVYASLTPGLRWRKPLRQAYASFTPT